MDFAWDDSSQILENPQIQSLRNVPSLFISEVWAGVKGETSNYYRPLFTLSLAVDYFLWGKHPFGYHLSNMLFHIFVSVTVYILCLKILRNGLSALFAALIFVSHPVHAEAVAWISGRNEMLAALFMLFSFYLYLVYKERGKLKYMFFSLSLFLLALLSKEMAITLPVIILVYELCYGEGTLPRKLLHPALYGFVAVPYLIIRIVFLQITWKSYPLMWRLYTSPGLIIKYLRYLSFPANLTVFNDSPIEKAFSMNIAISLIFLVIVCFLIARSIRYDKRVFFGLLFVLISLFPVSGLPTLLTPALMADRYLYIPSFGFSLAIGSMFLHTLGRTEKVFPPEKNGSSIVSSDKRKKIAMSFAFAVFFIFSIMTFRRNPIWKDDYTFTSRMVQDAPDSLFPHLKLGKLFESSERFDDAIKEFKIASALDPLDASAHNGLGIVYARMGRSDDAVEELQTALHLNPNNIKAHYNLGNVYDRLGRQDDAVRELQTAVKLDPEHSKAHYELGLIYEKQQRLDDAAGEIEQAIKLGPEDACATHNSLGVIYLQQQHFQEAAAEFETALHFNPNYIEAFNNLGLLYRRQNRLQEAATEFQNILRISPNYADAHNNLGIIYALAGKFDDATAQFQDALKLNPNNESFRKNLLKATQQAGRR